MKALLLSFSFPYFSRQDVANQMCTKTKEECEKHYMKHFINNPLFASTLLNLKQAEEAKTADSAIPFHCKCLYFCKSYLAHPQALFQWQINSGLITWTNKELMEDRTSWYGSY
jgi:hypothetical protein